MNKAPASVWRRPTHFLAFGLGSGAAPFAPGTFGTLAAIPFYWLLSELTLGWYLVMIAITFVWGVWLCDKTSRDLGVHVGAHTAGPLGVITGSSGKNNAGSIHLGAGDTTAAGIAAAVPVRSSAASAGGASASRRCSAASSERHSSIAAVALHLRRLPRCRRVRPQSGCHSALGSLSRSASRR